MKKVYIFLAIIIMVLAGVLVYLLAAGKSSKEISSNLSAEVAKTAENLPNDGQNDSNDQNTTTLSAKKSEADTTLAAAGDVMLSRHVGTKIRESKDNAHSFRQVASFLNEADLTFVNLEAPFYDQGAPVTEGMIFKAEPETLEGLKLSGIDVVSLANNHFDNQRRVGMKYTFEHLKNNQIDYCGAGLNYNEAHSPAIIERNGLKFAFLCYNGIGSESAGATVDLPGLAFAQKSADEVEADVNKAKEKADVVIVSLHHGTEYVTEPAWEQKLIAHAAIDAGAETVIGHHPHVVQKVEKYNGKPIVYSFGNLVFDQMWSQETREGAVGTYTFKGKNLERIEFKTVIIEDYNQPRFATASEEKRILTRMGVTGNILQAGE